MIAYEQPLVSEVDDTADFTEAQFPEKLQFLFAPARYKGAKGGRGGAKSWGYARALLIQASQRPLRILCSRETMQSIQQSVYQLLCDQIVKLKLEKAYDVQKSQIIGKNGSLFTFAGLAHNIGNIKSLESYDIVWVEEAQTVSKSSWDTLIPTLRKDGSEIWLTWNPILETDDTHKRFVLHPPSTAKIVEINWRDNPWFPETLRVEMEELRRNDFESYLHVYEGQCIKAVEGAIFRNEMKAALAEGRICKVPYNRARKVDTVWDLGYGDLLTIWFVQAYDGYFHFLDYLSGEGQTVSDYLIQLQHKQYLYGTDWLPHDGLDTIIHKRLAGLSAGRDMSIEMIMRDAGRTVRMVPKVYVTDRINAARTIFPQCKFDEEKCADGLQALRHYAWGPIDEKSGVRARKPLHNKYSHGADSFTMAALAIKPEKAQVQKKANLYNGAWPTGGDKLWLDGELMRVYYQYPPRWVEDKSSQQDVSQYPTPFQSARMGENQRAGLVADILAKLPVEPSSLIELPIPGGVDPASKYYGKVRYLIAYDPWIDSVVGYLDLSYEDGK